MADTIETKLSMADLFAKWDKLHQEEEKKETANPGYVIYWRPNMRGDAKSSKNKCYVPNCVKGLGIFDKEDKAEAWIKQSKEYNNIYYVVWSNDTKKALSKWAYDSTFRWHYVKFYHVNESIRPWHEKT